jgi:glycosyltransferase involved in cell wall biosynthesis
VSLWVLCHPIESVPERFVMTHNPRTVISLEFACSKPGACHDASPGVGNIQLEDYYRPEKYKQSTEMSMHEAPLVSLVTPVYNGAAFLAECIESVLKQTYGNYEYIIVNNCSTDRTLEIAMSYATNDRRIQVRTNDQFVGVIENHNIGFSLISPASKYCKIVSADDFIFPECLKQMIEFADSNASVGMVGSYSLAGKRVMNMGLEYERKVVAGREICRETLLGGPYVFGSPTSLLYRSDLIRASKAFYPTSNPHSDTTACYQSLEHCDFGFVHQVLSYSRIHPDTQTSRSIKFGTIKRALIGDLTRFGPTYLSRDELERRVRELMDWYYGWLVRGIFEHPGDSEFWQAQRVGLQEMGFEFSSARLFKAAVLKALGFLLRPGVAMKKVMGIKKDTGKVEAQYYE